MIGFFYNGLKIDMLMFYVFCIFILRVLYYGILLYMVYDIE